MILFKFGSYTYLPATGELRAADGAPVALRHKVSSLLTYLLENRARLVSKQELLEALWQHSDYRENSLTQSIKELRKALGDSARAPEFVKTFPQRGYQWIALVTEEPLDAEPDAGGEVKSPTPEPSQASRKTPRALGISFPRVAVLALCLTLMAGAAFWLTWSQRGTAVTADSSSETTPSLLVFPFTNETGDPGKEWLELGFADMLANHIQASTSLRVMTPAVTNALLLSEQLDWPALPVHIRGLLNQRQEDYALLGSVREHNNSQVLDFQLLYRDGRTKQGSIIYPSLPDATGAVAQQIVLLLQTEHDSRLTLNGAKGNFAQGLAGQALAEGMNALYLTGPLRAHEFFQAAYLIDQQNPWALAYLAQSNVLLGRWQEAQAQLREVESAFGGASQQLDAFRLYWQAELAHRQGNNTQARHKLELLFPLVETQASMQLAADAYRLQAQLAWSDRQWEEHARWLSKAHDLMPRHGDLHIEADKLYHLGSPISNGLDIDPQQDLGLSRARLQKALNLYTQLGSQPMLAATHLALAQNYQVDLDDRLKSLEKAIALYQATGQKHELVDSLLYATFFHLQFREGVAAADYAAQAQAVVDELGNHRSQNDLAFFKAFTILDQGLDQRHLGLHGPDDDKLTAAAVALGDFIASVDSPAYRASSLVLQAWAYAALGEHDQALAILAQARTYSRQAAMPVTEGYAIYSEMRIHLAREDYEKVIDLANEPVATRQQLLFLARAHYELGNFAQAVQIQSDLKSRFPSQWTAVDEERHQVYVRASQTDTPEELTDEPPMHAVYCESEWDI
ncbi:winged helix-turn-helix domain-containing protein [Marinimicrobium sp. ABcell2]|uniref:winged helix-turn-helix domain-containing protein n=1 Tax=Marinimicrobium sp. ABcell2 TaxID=3069751 RepID=UPI0027ADEF1F|nr:winged helix-turn-helix domain-containing protein [Marinimicrobium sp. ABcell2]MDQ2076883.1 winged helix-turn-helix domain-containing protein [Marinimicrobium sp. ABcell2]